MTYVVAEPCIRCKFTDCVAVCPVEAFKEGKNFLIIDPDGLRIDRQPIVEAIRRAHGRWRDAPGTIRIENFALHQSGDGYALATYEEWHDLPGGGNGRLSSVLFGEDESAPNGLVWLHLHEVWIQPEEPGQ